MPTGDFYTGSYVRLSPALRRKTYGPREQDFLKKSKEQREKKEPIFLLSQGQLDYIRNKDLDKQLIELLCSLIVKGDRYLIKKLYRVYVSVKKKELLRVNLPSLQQDCEGFLPQIIFFHHFQVAQIMMGNQNKKLCFECLKNEKDLEPIRYYLEKATFEDLGSFIKGVCENRKFFLAFTVIKSTEEQSFIVRAGTDLSVSSLLHKETNDIINLFERNKELINRLFLSEDKAVSQTLTSDNQSDLDTFIESIEQKYIVLFNRYRDTKRISVQDLSFLLSAVFADAISVFCDRNFKNNVTVRHGMISRMMGIFKECSGKFTDTEIHQKEFKKLLECFKDESHKFDFLYHEFEEINIKDGRPQYISYSQFEELFVNFILFYPKESQKFIQFLKDENGRPDLIPNFLNALDLVRGRKLSKETREEIEKLIELSIDKFNPDEIEISTSWHDSLVRDQSSLNLGGNNVNVRIVLASLEQKLTPINDEEEKKQETLESGAKILSTVSGDKAELPTELDEKKLTQLLEKQNQDNLEQKRFINGEKMLELQIQEAMDQLPLQSSGIFSFFKNSKITQEKEFLGSLLNAVTKKEDELPRLDRFEKHAELHQLAQKFRVKKFGHASVDVSTPTRETSRTPS